MHAEHEYSDGVASRLKRATQKSVGRLFYGLRLQRLLAPNDCVIVAFHRVNDETAGDGLTCGVEDFRAYCRFFARHYRVVSLGELIQRIEAEKPTGGQLAITFDDGYRDNCTQAAAVLRQLELPATFFITTGFIGTRKVPPWDRGLPAPPPWMSWDEVRDLRQQGFEIGAHTVHHSDLGAVHGEEARREIEDSRSALENALSDTVDLFAYPFGDVGNITEKNRERVKAAGFRCCVSCFGGVNGSAADPFRLRRVPISSWFVSPYHLGFDLVLRRV